MARVCASRNNRDVCYHPVRHPCRHCPRRGNRLRRSTRALERATGAKRAKRLAGITGSAGAALERARSVRCAGYQRAMVSTVEAKGRLDNVKRLLRHTDWFEGCEDVPKRLKRDACGTAPGHLTRGK